MFSLVNLYEYILDYYLDCFVLGQRIGNTRAWLFKMQPFGSHVTNSTEVKIAWSTVDHSPIVIKQLPKYQNYSHF